VGREVRVGGQHRRPRLGERGVLVVAGGRGRQAAAGSARMRASARTKSCCQGSGQDESGLGVEEVEQHLQTHLGYGVRKSMTKYLDEYNWYVAVGEK
jgi:hypothetical protein